MAGVLAQLRTAWKGAVSGPLADALAHLAWASWPTTCLGCGAVATGGGGLSLCAACIEAVWANDGPRCPACDGPLPAFVDADAPPAARAAACRCPLRPAWLAQRFVGTRAPYRYAGPLAQAIVAGKYAGARGVFVALGAALGADAQVCRLAAGFGLVAHVPTTRTRAARRGFDAGAVLAHALAGALGLPFWPVLERLDDAPSRSLAAKKAARGAPPRLRARPLPAHQQGRRVLLVDDVCTTGTSLQAAADALVAVGAVEVAAVVAARRG